MICPYCNFNELESARFCSNCGQRLEQQKQGGNSIGDIGLVRGNVLQTTIAGKAYFNETPSRPTASALLKQGIDLLNSGVFDEAARFLREALSADSSAQDAYLFLALSFLRGRRPKNIPFETAREVDGLLARSVAMRPEPAHVYLWLCVKYDFFLMNGLNVPPPSIDDLTATLSASSGIAASQLKWLIGVLRLPDDHAMVRIWR